MNKRFFLKGEAHMNIFDWTAFVLGWVFCGIAWFVGKIIDHVNLRTVVGTLMITVAVAARADNLQVCLDVRGVDIRREINWKTLSDPNSERFQMWCW